MSWVALLSSFHCLLEQCQRFTKMMSCSRKSIFIDIQDIMIRWTLVTEMRYNLINKSNNQVCWNIFFGFYFQNGFIFVTARDDDVSFINWNNLKKGSTPKYDWTHFIFSKVINVSGHRISTSRWIFQSLTFWI